MATGTEQSESGLLVDYRIQDAAIAEMRERLSGLSADTRDGYEQVRQGIGEIRTLRVAVEKRRVELKADALEYGRRVDAEAKRITAMLVEIEEPLKLEKKRIDDERERKVREAEEAERRRVEAELAAQRAAEEARLKAGREAEEARLRVEREAEEERLKAERARIDEERKRLEAERKEAERKAAEAAAEAERQRQELEAERRRLAKEQAEANRREQERLEAERQKIERERAEVERQRREAEEREALRVAAELQAKLEAEQAEKRRQLRPDAVKVRDWAAGISEGLGAPECQSEEARHVVEAALKTLSGVAAELFEWCDANAE